MISDQYYQKLASVESSNNPLAKNPKSSARGKYQFVSATASQYGLDKFDFGTPEYTKAEEQAVRKYTQDNYDYIKKTTGKDPTEGELYLAHQQGPGGAEKILTSSPEAKAIDVLGRDEVLNNGGTEDMTVEEFKQKWTSKFDKGEEQQQQQIVEPDALSDFGVNLGGDEPDAFSDFKVAPKDQFLATDDGFGGLKKSMIDTRSGAPSYIRQVVGSLTDPESRLATLQKYYPDAKPFEDDNFVYTNPETGKPTLYNPSGLDVGDVASATKTAFTLTGSAIGGALGAGSGVVASIPTFGTGAPVTIPAGTIAGAGIGAGVAANLWDAWMTLSGQTVDVRGPVEVAGETGAEVLGAGAGEGMGRALPIVAKEAIGGAKATSRAIVSQMESLGITPTLSATGGAGAKRFEAGLSQNVMSAEIMQKQADQLINESGAALQKVIKKYGKPKTKQGAGNVIFEAAERAVTAFEKKQEQLYTDAFDLVGRDTKINLRHVKALLNDYQKKLAKAPDSPTLQKTYGPSIKELKAILSTEISASKTVGTGLFDEFGAPVVKQVQTSKGGGLQFTALRDIRSRIGAEIGDPLTRTLDKQGMSGVYAALTKDMGSTVAAVSKEAASKISRADKYTKAWETTAAKTLEKILKYDATESAYKYAISASKDGGSSLIKLRKLFEPHEWDDVAATVLNQLGENPVSGEFSISKFMTNYNKLAPEAKDALFRGGRYKEASQALDEFTGLMGELKNVARYQNTSNTAGAMQVNLMLRNMGLLAAQGTAGAFGGEQVGAGPYVGAVGTILAPRLAAKLITNPSFVKWLAKPVREGTKDLTSYFGELVAIGAANPEMKEAINELINVMDFNTKQ